MRDEQERANDNKEFEKSIKDKTELFELIKETLADTAKKEFEKQGFESVEGEAGMYGDESTYGAGAKAEHFSVKISGKTLPSMERILQLGAKRIVSEVKCVLQNGRLKINYNSLENAERKNMIVRKELSLSTTLSKQKIKKQLEDLFSEAAMLEVAYLESVSLGTETGSQKYLNTNQPTMENIKKTLTIKEIFTSEGKDEYTELPGDEENIDKVKDKNTIDLGDKKQMLLDKNTVNEIADKMKSDKSYQKFFKETLNKFECKSLGEVKQNGKEQEFLEELNNYTVSEITAVGGGAAGAPSTGVGGGAGAYLTPFAFKKPGSGSTKKDLKGPFVELAPEAKSQVGETLKENNNLTKDLRDTTYFQNRATKRPKIDGSWNIVSEAGGDPYTIPAKVDPNTHAAGLPFLKPNSEEEAKANAAGDPGKMKRMGIKKLDEVSKKVTNNILSESDAHKTERLSKKRFNSILENEKLGVNKRYIITEKTTKEYEKERMSRLAGFKLYETIKGAENLSEVLGAEPELEVKSSVPEGAQDCGMFHPDFGKDTFDGEGENNFPEDFALETPEASALNEETVEIQKPGSLFGLTYKFKKKDFLSENKKYILDMNSMVFVPNPNVK